MRKKKRKTGRIILIIFLVLVIALGIFLWAQRNNLQALRYAQYTPEERQVMLEENHAHVDEILESLPVDALNPLTEEQEVMLQKGEITEDEALQIIMGKPEAPESVTGSEKVESNRTSNPEEAEVQGGTNARLQELLAQVYLLRASYTGQINGLVEQAKAEYVHQMQTTGKASKASIGASYITKGLELERTCDGQMETLLAEIKSELSQMGEDTALVKEIQSAYQGEKSIKKAELMGKYVN